MELSTLEEKLLPIIDKVRADPEAIRGYDYLSTSEFITVCLAVGTHDSLSKMDARGFPDIPGAWRRIVDEGRQVILKAWAP